MYIPSQLLFLQRQCIQGFTSHFLKIDVDITHCACYTNISHKGNTHDTLTIPYLTTFSQRTIHINMWGRSQEDGDNRAEI